ncbi:MAG: glutamine synthetase family protein [Alicyclobacillus sp.]|nr:glutamine synthetase family protein [Alicyclobacillus sp.]
MESNWIPHIQEAIRQHQIQTVRVCVQDVSNVSRSRYVPVRRFLQLLSGDARLSFPSALFSLDTAAALQRGVGETYTGGYPSWYLDLDLKSFSVLPYAPGVARIIADVVTAEAEPVPLAPRQVLKRVLSEYDALGYRVLGSFEYEFYAFREVEGTLKPAWDGLQCFAETKQAEVESVILAVLNHLTEMGAGPEAANTEYGAGQFEVSNSPFWGVEIADMAFYYRSSIKEILAQKGYRASFLSKPRNGMSGSGAHLHHSVHDSGDRNIFFDPNQPDGLSDCCRWFVGGQLYHARTISALCNSTVNSYKRLQAGTFAPDRVSWGYDNRSCMIRIPAARGSDTRVENRLPGADTNPYVALAITLAAGLDGIRQRMEPGAACGPTENAYASASRLLPRSLGEALDDLERDAWAKEVLGPAFVEHYLALRRLEYERFLRHVTDWELEEYGDVF